MYQLDSNKFLSEQELKSLKESLYKNREKDLKKTIVLDLALATGARAQELCNLKIKDLNPIAKTILIRGVKKSRNREIPLRPELFGRVELFSHGKSLEDRIFDIETRYLRDIWYEYRPCKKPFHCLRHTFALELYKQTKDIKLVQLCLGHVSVKNTNVYVDFVYTTEQMRKLMHTPYARDTALSDDG